MGSEGALARPISSAQTVQISVKMHEFSKKEDKKGCILIAWGYLFFSSFIMLSPANNLCHVFINMQRLTFKNLLCLCCALQNSTGGLFPIVAEQNDSSCYSHTLNSWASLIPVVHAKHICTITTTKTGFTLCLRQQVCFHLVPEQYLNIWIKFDSIQHSLGTLQKRNVNQYFF